MGKLTWWNCAKAKACSTKWKHESKSKHGVLVGFSKCVLRPWAKEKNMTKKVAKKATKKVAKKVSAKAKAKKTVKAKAKKPVLAATAIA